LVLHGHSRAVPVHYRAERTAGGLTRIAGSLQLDMRDFEIVPPRIWACRSRRASKSRST